MGTEHRGRARRADAAARRVDSGAPLILSGPAEVRGAGRLAPASQANSERQAGELAAIGQSAAATPDKAAPLIGSARGQPVAGSSRQAQSAGGAAAAASRQSVLPDGALEDSPAAWGDHETDRTDDLLRDVPPHWS
ncbi:MAG: hypothetical protein LBO20_09235 [Bifidobacteriaceae bacterium]|jgi:hypothetical protein|nr:hypothetical protein [Bifidobacteriaceae bacterium]